jgi:hypothetical protein
MKHRVRKRNVMMARELGLNPKNFGKLANHRQEPWKMPLPQFIEHLYLERFGKEQPDTVISIEERARHIAAKKAARRAAKSERQGYERSVDGLQAQLPPQNLKDESG